MSDHSRKPILEGEIIRYREGRSALMRVDSSDKHCGYVTYHGTHIYGERISVSGDKCRVADKKDIALFEAHRNDRHIFTSGL